MPKAVWGKGLDEDAVESAESKDLTVYDGPLPTNRTVGVVIESAKYVKQNSNKNPMASFRLRVDGSMGKGNDKYDCCPIWDQIVGTAGNAWKVKDFCAALGISAGDYLRKMVIDEEGNITKIGAVKPVGSRMMVISLPDKDQKGNDRVKVGKMLPVSEEAEASDAKGKKGKKGKKAADEEAPF